jgi:hypothetical protein
VFEPALSIIDVLMWNSPADILRHLGASAGRDESSAQSPELPSQG